MRRKNVLDYILLALFIMCMAFAVCASIEYTTLAKERPYMKQGVELLGMVGLSLALFVGIRLSNRMTAKWKERTRDLATVVICGMLFTAGLVLRVLVIECIPMAPDSDFGTYYRLGGLLTENKLMTDMGKSEREYVTLYPHTIGFPMLILQSAFAIFGQSVRVAQYANLVCSMISVLVCIHIGRKVAGRFGAVLAAMMMSLWPSHIMYSNMVASEQSFTMLILIAADIMASVLPRRKGSLYDKNPGAVMALLAVMGIVLALAEAIRPMAVLLAASFGVVQCIQGHDPEGRVPLSGLRHALSKGWLCLLVMLLPYLAAGVVMDSTVGNLVGQQPARGIAASGYNLMVGVNAQAQGHWNEADAQFFSDSYDALKDASAAHRACMQVAFQRIADEPENVMNLLVYKFRDLWQTDDFGIDWNLYFAQLQGTLTPELSRAMEAVRPVGRVVYMAVLVFSLLYGINLWRGKTAGHPMAMVCIIFFLGTALSHMLLETQVRYHYNMLPFLMLLATMGMTSWRKRVQEEVPVQVVYQPVEAPAQEHADNTHFDMRAALVEGNIIMTVTEAYQTEAEMNAQTIPAEPDVSAEPEVPAEAEVPAEPEVPVEPETAAEPDVSAGSEIPVEPEMSAEPEIPTEPGIPAELEVPVEPEIPAEPEVPAVPEVPVIPAAPVVPVRQAKVLPVSHASGKQAVRYTPDMIKQLRRQQNKHSK